MIFDLVNFPEVWNSAWRPIEYEFEFASGLKKALTSVTNDGGNAELNFSLPFVTKFVVGNKVYIESGDYEGEHEILTVTSQQQITIDTPYTATSTANVINLVVPLVKVYKGYLSSEPYDTELPFTLIAEFTPEVSPDYTLRFDVSGYAQSMFTIQPPTAGIDFSLFNQIRVYLYFAEDLLTAGGTITFQTTPYKVLNSAIETAYLNSRYYNTGRYLTPTIPAVIFNCGSTFLTYINNSFAYNQVYEGEPISGSDFNDDFNNDFG